MYTSPHFAETDDVEINRVIGNHPFATLIATTQQGIIANHIPVFRNRDGNFIGHIAKANDLHRIVENGAQVLLIFHGQDAYISPNWYPTKADHHKQVPTWNYQVVHVYGHIQFSHDEKQKRAVVGILTKVHETQVNGQDAWRMSDAPADYMAEKLAGIVGFEIAPDRIVAKSKLGQNKDKIDFDSVVDQMAVGGKTEMANRMKKR